MKNSFIIDDFIVLGKAAADEMSDGRKSLCVAGYSHKKGFIRVYPTNIYSPFHQWNLLRIPLERNNRDNRFESWKIVGSRDNWINLHEKVEIIPEISPRGIKKPKKYKESERLNLVNNLRDECVKDINEEKRSLGIVKPIEIEGYFTDREDVKEEKELLSLENFLGEIRKKDNWVKTKGYFEKIPYLKYRCENCKTQRKFHKQQLLSIEVYEWMRKEPEKMEQVWENFRILDPEYYQYLFVGNNNKHRNSFMVIQILRFKKTRHKLGNKPIIPLKKYEKPKEKKTESLDKYL